MPYRPGRGWAIVVSSLLFPLAHLPNLLAQGLPVGPHLVVKMTTLLVFGLLMAWTVVETGGIWFAIGWHAGTNYSAVVEGFLFAAEQRGPAWLAAYPGGWPVVGVVYAMFEVVAVLGLLSAISARAGTVRREAS